MYIPLNLSFYAKLSVPVTSISNVGMLQCTQVGSSHDIPSYNFWQLTFDPL